mgnify:CR=1 FL=1
MNKELDEQNESKAYLADAYLLYCKLQFKAQGEVNSSIKDRFFASASKTPSRVMGILLTQICPCISEKRTKGAYSKSITEIAVRIGNFPDKLTLTQRGEFALGYYYQYAVKQNENNNNNN